MITVRTHNGGLQCFQHTEQSFPALTLREPPCDHIRNVFTVELDYTLRPVQTKRRTYWNTANKNSMHCSMLRTVQCCFIRKIIFFQKKKKERKTEETSCL